MPHSPAPSPHRRILVVQDQYMLAEDPQRDLERLGIVVIGPAPSATIALRLIAATPVLNGAILDIDLQGKPSFPVADVLRARGIPFVFTTSHEVSILPVAYRDVRRFVKPVDMQEVVRAVLA